MIMKWIIAMIISFLMFSTMIYSFPFVWKFFGGTFINGNEIIYKGKTLYVVDEKCYISTTEEMKKITVICKDKKIVWIDGIQQNK